MSRTEVGDRRAFDLGMDVVIGLLGAVAGIVAPILTGWLVEKTGAYSAPMAFT